MILAGWHAFSEPVWRSRKTCCDDDVSAEQIKTIVRPSPFRVHHSIFLSTSLLPQRIHLPPLLRRKPARQHKHVPSLHINREHHPAPPPPPKPTDAVRGSPPHPKPTRRNPWPPRLAVSHSPQTTTTVQRGVGSKNHSHPAVGFVIMPDHVHPPVWFPQTGQLRNWEKTTSRRFREMGGRGWTERSEGSPGPAAWAIRRFTALTLGPNPATQTQQPNSGNSFLPNS